ncbi:tyrosine-type recombinase/integrase [Nakamurella sp.]|uniref:tyrosine-type recombinase/integrase n=1 Tax=Nakamurella sp. TaxID=1869182 RepID=UPI003783D786
MAGQEGQQRQLRASTLRMYRRYVTEDISPALGRYRLSDLHPQVVDEFVAGLLADGRGKVTVRRIHATLSSALTSARKLRLIAVNPAADVELPDGTRRKVRPWEPAELGTFLGVAAEHRLGALFEVAAFTGLRRGELCALRWSDVDLVNQVITVRTQLVHTGSQRLEGKPKTRSGEDRRLDIGSRVVGALLAHQLAQQSEREAAGTAYQDNDRVFCREDGADLDPDNVSRIFRRLVAKAELRPVRLHDVRHGAASLMLASGTDIAVVSKRLGHSTLSLTADTYSHLIGGIGRQAADAAEAIVPASAHTLHTSRPQK